MIRKIAAGAGLSLLAGYAIAQDVMKVVPEHYQVVFENDRVRVVQNTLKPGESDPIHTHPAGWYYVTSPSSLKLSFTDGNRTVWQQKPGESGWIEAEPPHTAENVGKAEMQFVLVEVKSPGK